MHAAFKSMSDLVADAEDLVARVAHSQTPEVRALAYAVQLSANRVTEQLRKRARGLRPCARVKGPRTRGWRTDGSTLPPASP
jgi:hypothetical protein